MPRIRTIKPEFPQSESIGRISRDARLLFIELWTLCDDSGRTRAASRMLASLLFPYDDDAPGLIDGWCSELEREGCIIRYTADGATYIQVCNWLNHQKIDRPSQSKIPPFDESSRILANPRESSSVDQGSKDQGSKDHSFMSGKPSALPDASPLSRQKNGQHYNPQAREVLEFLNAKTGRHYQPVDANLKLIVARLKEGASVSDCRAVVAKKAREWSADDKMAEYLRPATLFNATKFAQYRGELTEVQND